MPHPKFYDNIKCPEKYIKVLHRACKETVNKFRSERLCSYEEGSDIEGYDSFKTAGSTIYLSKDRKHTFIKSPPVPGHASSDYMYSPYAMFFSKKEWGNRFHHYSAKFAANVRGRSDELVKEQGIESKDSKETRRFQHAQNLAAKIWYKGVFSKLPEDIHKQRSVGKKFWTHLDPEVMSIIVRAKGPAADSIDYCSVANNLENIKKLVDTTPGIIPFFLMIQKLKINQSFEKTDLGVFSGKQWMQEQAIEADYSCENIVNSVQTFLYNIRCYNHKIWKMIVKMPMNRTAMIASRMLRNGNEMSWIIKMLSEIGGDLTYTLFKHFLSHGRFIVSSQIQSESKRMDLHLSLNSYDNFISSGRPYDINFFANGFYMDDMQLSEMDMGKLVPFWRSAFRESKKRNKNFYRDDVSLAIDWMKNEQPVLDHNQKKASWKWFAKKQEDWHEEQRLERAREREEQRKKHFTTWESYLEECELDKCRVVPLTDTDMLYEEGDYMLHCISSYYISCSKNKSRIFSIRDGEKRVATCEIKSDSQFPDISKSVKDPNTGVLRRPKSVAFRGWKVSQIRGIKNAPVSKPIEKLGSKIARMYANEEKSWIKRQLVSRT